MSMREAWNKTWAVNTTSTYVLTHKFVPLLLKSSDPRLLFITSGLSTLAESSNTAIMANRPLPKGWPKQRGNTVTGVPVNLGAPSYRSSKTGMNMMMREWVRVLKEDGVCGLWRPIPGDGDAVLDQNRKHRT